MSFRRKTATASSATGADADAAAPRAQLRGTKPFVNGQALLSTGLAQLDALLGGGLLLGTLVLLETPHASAAAAALAADLQRYFCAEGIAAAQRALLLTADAAGFARHQLPLELSLAQSQLKQSHHLQQQQQQPEAPLTIAWQYAKYLAAAPDAAHPQRFCHSFDLARPMHRELLDANPPALADVLALDAITSDPPSPREIYEQLLQRVAEEISAANDRVVLRVSMQELGSPLFGPADAAHMTALFAFVRRLRVLVSSRPVVCVLSGPLYAFAPEFANEVRHLCDYALDIKAFMGEQDMLPAELRDFHGLLDVRKLARVHSLACHSMDATKFGLKRERRKLKIEKFHLPPEGSRSSSSDAAGSSTSNLVGASVAKQSSASSSCGVSSSSVYDPLAF